MTFKRGSTLLYRLLAPLSKQEILRYCRMTCIHRKNYFQHPACFSREVGDEEQIGFLDIETEDLRADYGIIFCWCLKNRDSNKIYSDIITLDDIKKYPSRTRNCQPKEDTRIIKSLIRDMSNFTRIVTHYGSRFDLSFIRTRAVINKIPYPAYGSYVQTDTWRILRDKFRLSRNSLENSHLKLFGYTRKDHLSLSIKHGCLRGEEWALKLVLKHCKSDVLDTEELYNLIYPFVKSSKTSI